MRSKHLVLCGSVIVVLAGCGGDDSSDSSDETTEQKTAAAEQPAATETAPETAGSLPEPGAEKLTAAQKGELLAKNNQVALGDSQARPVPWSRRTSAHTPSRWPPVRASRR